MKEAELLAKAFHVNYESLAPLYGYETRKESRVAWSDVPPANKALMIAVCQKLLETQIVALHPLLKIECAASEDPAPLPPAVAPPASDDDTLFR